MPDDEEIEKALADLIKDRGLSKAKHLFRSAILLERKRNKRPRKKLTAETLYYILAAFVCVADMYPAKSKKASLNEMFNGIRSNAFGVPIGPDFAKPDFYYPIKDARTAANLHARAIKLAKKDPESFDRFLDDYLTRLEGFLSR